MLYKVVPVNVWSEEKKRHLSFVKLVVKSTYHKTN